MRQCLNKKKQLRQWIFRILSVLWMLLIFSFSAQEGDDSAGLSDRICQGIVCGVDEAFDMNMSEEMQLARAELLTFPVRKAAHMTEYGILGLMLYLGFSNSRLAILLTFLYAMTDEFHQYFVPGRDGNFPDVLIDTAGALIVLGIVKAIRFKRLKRGDSCG